ncbi:hypothetical protein [Streptomyces sp. NBC_00989]|uniref:hypothetical protein n=1 Tax=Streptomyces sp. NBC_00989 TaxID=2903705 RepID=UPI00386F4D8B|nr:hypothetical protein OG714_38275 [Streptomyces sp. NBC_00989]
MSDDFPPGVTTTIRHALVFNLRDGHRRYGADLPAMDLYPDIIRALKWVHAEDPDRAHWLAWSAFEDVSSHAEENNGPPLEAAISCLRHSLTRETPPFGSWTEEEADRFITAARTRS